MMKTCSHYIILSQECQDFCHDTKKQVRVFQGGFITAQLIKFSLQLGTTFYLRFITLTFSLSEII